MGTGGGAAKMVARRHRPFRGEYLEHVFLNLVRQRFEFRQAEFGKLPMAINTQAYSSADDLVGVAERDTLAYQVVGQISRSRVTAGGGQAHLTVTGAVTLSGMMTANGGGNHSSGSGGSIFLTAGTLTGAGAIVAIALLTTEFDIDMLVAPFVAIGEWLGNAFESVKATAEKVA